MSDEKYYILFVIYAQRDRFNVNICLTYYRLLSFKLSVPIGIFLRVTSGPFLRILHYTQKGQVTCLIQRMPYHQLRPYAIAALYKMVVRNEINGG